MNGQFNKIISPKLVLIFALGFSLVTAMAVEAEETGNKKYLAEMEITATSGSRYDIKYSQDNGYNNFLYEIDANYNNFTVDSPLEIKNAVELAAFAKTVNDGKNFANQYVKLTANIDLDGNVPEINEEIGNSGQFKVAITGQAENVWGPIGNNEYPFQGTFDGDGHTIENMVVLETEQDSSTYAGLFGKLKDATIENLGITNCTVISNSKGSYAGSLAGAVEDNIVIENCCAVGKVYALNTDGFGDIEGCKVGGLVGESNINREIKSSYAQASVYALSSISNDKVYAGGLIGQNIKGNIDKSYSSGNIYASCSNRYSEAYAGGLAAENSMNSSTISNAYSTGDVSAFGAQNTAYSGGLAGIANCNIRGSYAAGNVYAYSGAGNSKAYIGKLVGSRGNSDTGDIEGCYTRKDAAAEPASAQICVEGEELEFDQMTGVGEGRASDKMSNLNINGDNAWIFTTDLFDPNEDDSKCTKHFYFPCLKNVGGGAAEVIKIVDNELKNCVSAVIKGDMEDGEELQVDVTIADGYGREDLEPKYQWFVGGKLVEGETRSTYTIKEGDIEKGIFAEVTVVGINGVIIAEPEIPKEGENQFDEDTGAEESGNGEFEIGTGNPDSEIKEVTGTESDALGGSVPNLINTDNTENPPDNIPDNIPNNTPADLGVPNEVFNAVKTSDSLQESLFLPSSATLLSSALLIIKKLKKKILKKY